MYRYIFTILIFPILYSCSSNHVDLQMKVADDIYLDPSQIYEVYSSKNEKEVSYVTFTRGQTKHILVSVVYHDLKSKNVVISLLDTFGNEFASFNVASKITVVKNFIGDKLYPVISFVLRDILLSELDAKQLNGISGLVIKENGLKRSVYVKNTKSKGIHPYASIKYNKDHSEINIINFYQKYKVSIKKSNQ